MNQVMEEHKEECKGCISFMNENCAHGIIDNTMCPCQTCIVKVICQSGCKEFIGAPVFGEEYGKQRRV